MLLLVASRAPVVPLPNARPAAASCASLLAAAQGALHAWREARKNVTQLAPVTPAALAPLVPGQRAPRVRAEAAATRQPAAALKKAAPLVVRRRCWGAGSGRAAGRCR